MNITVVGIGYVGISNAILLSQKHRVIIMDINKDKVNLINCKKSPIEDELIEEYIQRNDINLIATLDKKYAFENSDYIIIATPTNYDENANYFDTSSIEKVIEEILRYNDKAIIIIKSTIPIGYTDKLKSLFKTDNIIFSPEFLREGKALYDNLYPSRIIIGEKSSRAKYISELFTDCCLKKDVKVLLTSSKEAESIKLFANTYLAMRIGFFNELDSYARVNKLNTEEIINGVSADPRIGDYYNNPSFGYGGYCLPKDTKQLLANYLQSSTPNILIESIVKTNEIRKKFIIESIISRSDKTIGVYRLLMKKDSDNFRNSVMLDLINSLKKYKNIIIYEPLIKESCFYGCIIENKLSKFLQIADLIVANRIDDVISKYQNKIFTTDIFKRDI
ncbi:nucleotide sugar dehydrogenase [Campylobacter molothri]|uniref:Nucleotide sugar dehydrogenase n=1 Tax=Campylobacter molothri TaxID=1032242 RepID=A0ACC5W2I6_9BACT|nr:nucleotide sugar dehydrogenase [Campylobacter sp. RM9929]MBZ7958966.1 nucleotide sugar dehydrogenase [Campylobacter sp. RM9760]MBZ7975154.1 nucleotide sugar dehydrogenase [Campylobacter sp. RM9754]